jgi:hypothetical protein
MKIPCYLDFDGVLNSQIDWENLPETADKSEMLFERPIKQLNQIADRCEFVVSSTWRMGDTIESLQQMLDNKGFKGKLIGATPVFRETWAMRGNEIHAHAEANGFNSYIIIDDDGDMLLPQRECFFQTDPYCGLTYTLVGQINRYLDKICIDRS